MLYSKKAGVPIVIVMLVLLTIALIMTALVSFSLRNNQVSKNIYGHTFLDDVYAKEKLINFYIQEITDKSVEGIDSEEHFISNFKTNLASYKDNNGLYVLNELAQVESRLNNDNVELITEGEGKKILLNLQLIISTEFKEDGERRIMVSYTYTRVFRSEAK